MAPIKWFKVEDTPFDCMWVEHKYWYPMALKQIPFKGYFKHKNDDSNTMLDSNIKLLNSIEKTRQLWVIIIFKKYDEILLNTNDKKWKYLSKFHERVQSGETPENTVLRLV